MASKPSKKAARPVKGAEEIFIPVLVRTNVPVEEERDDNEDRENVYLSKFMHPEVKTFSASDLRSGIGEFLDGLKVALGDATAAVGSLQLDEISVAAEINGKGGLTWLGLAEIGGKAGITFKFKRPTAKP